MFSFLPVATVQAMVPLARELGVSEVARGKKGFVRAYAKAGRSDGLSAAWHEAREAFILRQLAQTDCWWTDYNMPTPGHLALIMWAYSPSLPRLNRFLKGKAK